MKRENPRITTAAAAAIAVFAVSGPVGPFGATAYGQQAAHQSGDSELIGTRPNPDNPAVQKRNTLSSPELAERVQQQGSHDIRRGLDRAGDSRRTDAGETDDGEIERYANAPTGDIRRNAD